MRRNKKWHKISYAEDIYSLEATAKPTNSIQLKSNLNHKTTNGNDNTVFIHGTTMHDFVMSLFANVAWKVQQCTMWIAWPTHKHLSLPQCLCGHWLLTITGKHENKNISITLPCLCYFIVLCIYRHGGKGGTP